MDVQFQRCTYGNGGSFFFLRYSAHMGIRAYRQSPDCEIFLDWWVTKFSKLWSSVRAHAARTRFHYHHNHNSHHYRLYSHFANTANISTTTTAKSTFTVCVFKTIYSLLLSNSISQHISIEWSGRVCVDCNNKLAFLFSWYNSIPEQVSPLPMKPTLHSHLKEPSVFMHSPSSWQLWVFSWHSSISWKKQNMKSKRGYNLTACSQELSCPAFTGKKRKVLKESIIPIQDTPSPV